MDKLYDKLVSDDQDDEEFEEVYEAYERFYKENKVKNSRGHRTMDAGAEFYNKAIEYMGLEEDENDDILGGATNLASMGVTTSRLTDEQLTEEELKDLLEGKE